MVSTLTPKKAIASPEQILGLFPCRNRGIWNGKDNRLKEDGKPAWTERKFINGEDLARFGEKDFFLGVSFNVKTCYGMADIDRGSPIHPENNWSEFKRFLEWLDSIGFISPLILRSSHSGGLHIYLICPEEVGSYALGASLTDRARAADFEVAKGKLEFFPNKKSKNANYGKHRLPLQQGSLILDSDLTPIGDSWELFNQLWEYAAEKNDLAEIKKFLSDNFKLSRGIAVNGKLSLSSKQQAWKAALKKTIDRGWNGSDQTETILGAIAAYGVVFENEGQGITDLDELTAYVIKTAENAPGYSQWCRNAPDYCGQEKAESTPIEVRARGWAKSSLHSNNPVGFSPKQIEAVKATLPEKELTPEERKQDALERQLTAVDEAIANNLTFPTKTKAMDWLVEAAKTSMQTINKNMVILWEKIKTLIVPSQKQSEQPQDKDHNNISETALSSPKLSCNSLPCKDSGDSGDEDKGKQSSCNPLPCKDSNDISNNYININDLCIYPEGNELESEDYPAYEQGRETRHLSFQQLGTSVSAQDRLPNTQIVSLTTAKSENDLTSLSYLKSQQLQHIQEKRQLMRICKALCRLPKPELFAELDQLVSHFGLSVVTDWTDELNNYAVSVGFEIWKQHQQSRQEQIISSAHNVEPTLSVEILNAVQDGIVALYEGNQKPMQMLCSKYQNFSLIRRAAWELEQYFGAVGMVQTLMQRWQNLGST